MQRYRTTYGVRRTIPRRTAYAVRLRCDQAYPKYIVIVFRRKYILQLMNLISTVQCTLYTVQCILYVCTVYIVQYTHVSLIDPIYRPVYTYNKDEH